MKRFIRIMAIILVCVLLAGCGNNNAKVKLASKKLTTELDRIITQVNKMEDIDTNQMDISSSLGKVDYEYYDDLDNKSSAQDKNVNNSRRYNNGGFDGYARRGTPMEMDVPTGNKLVKQTCANSNIKLSDNNVVGGHAKKTKNFNFVSKEAEKNYSSLYSLCNDCCSLNEELKCSKKDLVNNCENAKTLLSKLKKSGINISESDLKTLNSYTEVLSKCVSNLNKNESCKKCVKNVNNKKANLAQNCGSINSDYLQIYNTLDSNCCSCNNCNMSVEDLITFVTKLLDSSNKGVTRDNVKNAPSHYQKSNYTRNSRKATNPYQSNRTFESKMPRPTRYEKANKPYIWNRNKTSEDEVALATNKADSLDTKQEVKTQSGNYFDKHNNGQNEKKVLDTRPIDKNKETQNNRPIYPYSYNQTQFPNRSVPQPSTQNTQNIVENQNKDIVQSKQQNHHDKQSENTNQIAKEIKNEDKISSIAGPKVYTTKNITSHDQSTQTNSLDRQQFVQKDKNNINNLNNQRVPNSQTNSRPNGYYNNAQNNNQNREHNFSSNQQNPSRNQSGNSAINNTRPVPIKNTTPPPTYNGARPNNSSGLNKPAPSPRFDGPKNVSVPHNMSIGPKNVRAEIA